MKPPPPKAPSSDPERKRWMSDVARLQAGMRTDNGRLFMLKALRAAYQLGKADAAGPHAIDCDLDDDCTCKETP